MLENFIDSAIIIDDKTDEVAPLILELEAREIFVKHYLPKDLVGKKLNNRKIIFLDLYLDDTEKLPGNISKIRTIFRDCLGPNYGTYGIVLWSNHAEEIGEFVKRLSNNKDAEGNVLYKLPLFVIGAAKTKYLNLGKNYSTLIDDINTDLNNNPAAAFFVYWYNLVKKGKDQALDSVYKIANRVSTQGPDLQYLLFKLAKNYTGIPSNLANGYDLENDALKAFNDILHSNISNSHTTSLKLFGENEPSFSGDAEETKKAYASLNTSLLLDFNNLHQTITFPGNIYEIVADQGLYCIEAIPEGARRIVIEVTPPCDFAGEKKSNRSRVLGGYYCTNNFSNTKLSEINKGESIYKELNNLEIFGINEPQLMKFDFRYFGSIMESDLKDVAKYKLICRAKDRLFADVLQKLSSHIARLGLSIIKS